MASLKSCENCGKEIYTNIKKCPYCKNKNNNRYKVKNKNRNIGIFFIKMVLLFIIVDLFVTIIPVYLGESVFNYKYGKELVVEALWCLCILVVLLMSGNSYVFTCKKEEFGKAIKLGLPMLIISGISLLANIPISLDGLNIWNFVNLILFCASIGLTEEFLCRGWVQNEFIERYGTTRKKVIVSIILSSLVFGVMHITNIFAGQTLFQTIMQIIQATALGALLGSVYYRSKNIWAVAFLHGFFDFAIMLSDVNLIKDCATGTVTNSIIIYQTFSTLCLSFLYIFYTVILLRKKDTHKLIDEKSELTEEELKKDQKTTNLMKKFITVIVILFFLPVGNNIDGIEEYEICYTYEEKYLDGYETHFSNYGIYEMYYKKVINNNGEANDLWENNKINNGVYSFTRIKDITKSFVSMSKRFYLVMFVYYDNDETKVYYNKINEKELNDSNEFLDNLKESFKSFDVPDIKNLGYLTYNDNEDNYYIYAYMVSELGYEFIIDENNQLFLLN